MTYTIPDTINAGDPISATQQMQVVNDIKAIWKGQAAGDVDYYDSATTKARLAAVAGALLGWNAAGTALEAKTISEIIKNRQGGDSANWTTQGTTNYSVAGAKIQCGICNFTVANNTGYKNITYPQSFTNVPLVFTAWSGDNGAQVMGGVTLASSFVTNSGFQISVYCTQSGSATVCASWLAIGI